ncbi:MutS-related protein, family 1 [Staphylococcus aureus]|nr:MutS-related protein, family 1 [Staphylococcus aureus]
MSTNQTFLIFVIAIILLTSVIGIVGRYMSRQRLLKSMETLWQTISPLEAFYQTELTFRL